MTFATFSVCVSVTMSRIRISSHFVAFISRGGGCGKTMKRIRREKSLVLSQALHQHIADAALGRDDLQDDALGEAGGLQGLDGGERRA